MKIKVAFWLDVEDAEALMRLAKTTTIGGAQEFLKAEATDHTWDYLDIHGIACRPSEGEE